MLGMGSIAKNEVTEDSKRIIDILLYSGMA